MAWWIWLNVVLTALLVVLAAAWVWAERDERRRQEAARRRREERLVAWQTVELPEPPETFPEPGTTRLDEDLVARLLDSDEFEQLRHFFGGYFHQDMDLEFDDEDDLVRAYVDGHARWPDDVVQLLQAMDKLLALGLSDKELVEAFDILVRTSPTAIRTLGYAPYGRGCSQKRRGTRPRDGVRDAPGPAQCGAKSPPNPYSGRGLGEMQAEGGDR